MRRLFPINGNRAPAGLTLAETLVVIALLAILFIPLSRLVRRLGSFITQGFFEWRASAVARPLDVLLQQDLDESVRLDEALGDGLVLTLDSNRARWHEPQADPDNDGLPNAVDPDDDNDLDAWPAPAQWQMRGIDVDDDDEDGDGRVDLRVRYRYDAGTLKLTREINENESGWTQVAVMEGVFRLQLAYFGSTNVSSGVSLDVGMDGLPGTGDAGEDNGVVTEEEIDRGSGNGNGVLDLREELRSVKVVAVTADFDVNRDGKPDFHFEKTLFPALWGYRRDWP